MTARLFALILILAVVAMVVLLPIRPTPLMVDPTPASIVLWKYLYAAPPQFCTAPMPVCPDGRCPMKKETIT